MKNPSGGRRGRPPADTVMVQIAIRLPAELIDEVDALVAELQADPLTRAERSAMIRSLIVEGLAARKARAKKK